VRSSSIVLGLCRLGVSRGSSLDGETARESYSIALINEDSDNSLAKNYKQKVAKRSERWTVREAG
jgi:hypothetical protein